MIKETNDKKAIGKGESAGIALAKIYSGVLASNNLKDIAFYIEKYNITREDFFSLFEN